MLSPFERITCLPTGARHDGDGGRSNWVMHLPSVPSYPPQLRILKQSTSLAEDVELITVESTRQGETTKTTTQQLQNKTNAWETKWKQNENKNKRWKNKITILE